jgi:hypothetical protein
MAPRNGTTAEQDSRGTQRGLEPLERVTVNLTARSSRALERASQLTSLNKTDSLNRAIQLFGYLEEIIEAGGDLYVRPEPGAELELLKLF